MNIIPYERKVFYYETDRMGIVHHSNYIRWMEEARIDFLKQIGLPYDGIEREGILIPVLAVAAEYKKPFRFGDSFRIELRLVEFSGIKFTIKYEIYKRETEELCATGQSQHAFVDERMMPVRLRKEYPRIYEGLMNRLEKKE
ncbi:MAG: acyl-CoA thioesterase [Lachnospiraceae bacterium]|nr:acyl-CoA thioesterase [Lachnospiraceae bacterium]